MLRRLDEHCGQALTLQDGELLLPTTNNSIIVPMCDDSAFVRVFRDANAFSSYREMCRMVIVFFRVNPLVIVNRRRCDSSFAAPPLVPTYIAFLRVHGLRTQLGAGSLQNAYSCDAHAWCCSSPRL